MVLYPTFGIKFRNFAVCGSYAIFKTILPLSSTIGVLITWFVPFPLYYKLRATSASKFASKLAGLATLALVAGVIRNYETTTIRNN
jgi:hypothetical protein